MLVQAKTDDAARQWARLGHLGLFERKRSPSRQPGRARTLKQLVCRAICGRSVVIYGRDRAALQALADELRADPVKLRDLTFWKLILYGDQVGRAIARATKASEVKL